MDKNAKNVFDDMITENSTQIGVNNNASKSNKNTNFQPFSNDLNTRKSRPLKLRGNFNTTAEASKSFCYRTTPGFYDNLQAFAKIKGVSLNTIIESALLQYMDQPENKDDASLARSIAERIRK